jgi:N-acetylmuramoyl-L-alanine amidase
MIRFFIPVFLVASICFKVVALPAPGNDSTDPGKGLSDSQKKANKRGEYAIRTIVIDAGHGGHDPGCVGKKSKEKDVALDISLKLGKMIEEQLPDTRVIYTRKTDKFLELHQRAAIANKANADLFISIHCNAAESKTSYGTETFVLGLHRAKDNLDVAKRENAAIYFENDYQQNYDGYDPNSPEGHILLSMFQNAFLDQSITLAEKIERNFVAHKRTSRGVKQGGFLVLRHATMPAVLVEAGFLSNLKEEEWLISQEGQNAIATSIFDAIKLYKSSYELKPKKELAVQTETKPASVSGETSNLNKIDFCVQYAVSSNPGGKPDPKATALAHVIIRNDGGVYKHQLSNISSYEEAQILRDKIRAAGYKDAFIVPYLDNSKITLQEALKQADRIAQQ